ncbi:hypothetical protein [Companilactobacillus metriopterae]|uniref:hypothetical protein n=1 Tax=Companilactobacillus metriopterae TaxID=1909267 RepID=UPI0013E93C85|nr:hypothetical protein [Companilactobacillus metriopterae]
MATYYYFYRKVQRVVVVLFPILLVSFQKATGVVVENDTETFFNSFENGNY